MDKFKPGERVVRVTPSRIPEGIKGTILGKCFPPYEALWEVEYDNFPNDDPGRSGVKARSVTSWFSREVAIELTREAVRAREAEKEENY